MELLTEFKTFEKNLKCESDETRSGLYTIFIYDDCDHMTLYNETAKKEYYISVEEFKKLYVKA